MEGPLRIHDAEGGISHQEVAFLVTRLSSEEVHDISMTTCSSLETGNTGNEFHGHLPSLFKLGTLIATTLPASPPIFFAISGALESKEGAVKPPEVSCKGPVVTKVIETLRVQGGCEISDWDKIVRRNLPRAEPRKSLAQRTADSSPNRHDSQSPWP